MLLLPVLFALSMQETYHEWLPYDKPEAVKLVGVLLFVDELVRLRPPSR